MLDETKLILPDSVGRRLRDRNGFIIYIVDGTSGKIEFEGHRAAELAEELVKRLGGEIIAQAIMREEVLRQHKIKI